MRLPPLATAVTLSLILVGCGPSELETETARKARAERQEKLKRYVAAGPVIVGELRVDNGVLRTIEVPQRGLIGNSALVSTCLLFVHQSGASSMSCPKESELVRADDL